MKRRTPSSPCYYRRLRLSSGYTITVPQDYIYELDWTHGTLLKITKENDKVILERVIQ